MNEQKAREEYNKALRMGQKEYRELVMSGKAPYPAILDKILEDAPQDSIQTLPPVEIPADRIIGTKSAGRIFAFTASFHPLLDNDTEFAAKWIHLCADHLSDVGIREPILCYEYLGYFYVQEGNKRVSVLKHFGAPRITGTVLRILPPRSDDPRIRAYYEFVDFYRVSRIYDVQFTHPGEYAQLLIYLGKEDGEEWTEWERRNFSAYFQYFKDAFYALGGKNLNLQPEEALLLWLKIYPFGDLGKLTAAELKKILQGMWDEIVMLSRHNPIKVQTEPSVSEKSVLSRLITSTPDHLNVAFIHKMDPVTSTWTKGHDEGRQHLEKIFPDKLTVRSYFNADTTEQADALLEQAVAEGAEVVFTTTPQLSRATLKAAVKYPKIRFLNCSADTPYSSVRSYYCRVFEGKFITGAIAGAMATNDRIGYVGSYPILGVPASINAFALGAQLTNPRAKVVLRWSCQPGSPIRSFMRDGIRVISNRDVPTPDKTYMEYGEYGTYLVDEDGTLTPLGSPCWVWGRFYENVIRSIFSGAWEQSSKTPQKAVNYWWGMNSGVIDVRLGANIPDGLASLAELLRRGLQTSMLDPFRRRIVAQDGTVKNDGNRSFSPDEQLHMDWLCENIEGSIPEYDEVLPVAQPLVRELGIHREDMPIEKEGNL